MYDFSVKLLRKDNLVNTYVAVTVQDFDSDFCLTRSVAVFRSLYGDRDDSFSSVSSKGFVPKDGASWNLCGDYCIIALPTLYGYNNGRGIKYTGNYHQVLHIRIRDFFRFPA